MPSLSERLKSLGVHKGADNLNTPKESNKFPIEDVVFGSFLYKGSRATFISQEIYPNEYLHGQIGLYIHTPLKLIAEWAGCDEIKQNALQDFAFIDIETSSISRGTGTFAFLVGLGRFIAHDFHLYQLFIRDPLDEPALLLVLEEFLSSCKTIVTFNGKSSDIPILYNRYTLYHWPSPLSRLSHIDLLHLARQLWRDRLPSRTLQQLEVSILGAKRSEEDIPGWLVPKFYTDYLREQDARPLKRVFYHNKMDVVSMAALLNHVAHILENECIDPSISSTDHAALGNLYEDLGYLDRADGEYLTSLSGNLPIEIRRRTILRLASMRKGRGDFNNAIPIWEQAASEGQIEALIELAKYYEHRAKMLSNALYWTYQAKALIEKSSFPSQDYMVWLNDINHRLDRLLRKSSRIQEEEKEELG